MTQPELCLFRRSKSEDAWSRVAPDLVSSTGVAQKQDRLQADRLFSVQQPAIRMGSFLVRTTMTLFPASISEERLNGDRLEARVVERHALFLAISPCVHVGGGGVG